MKKYIYGTILAAVVVACAVFFVGLPQTSDHAVPMALAVTFRLSEGYEFIDGAPSLLTWRLQNPDGTRSVPVKDKSFNPLVSPYRVILMAPVDSQVVVLNARLYYCQKTSRMCFQDDFETCVPISPERNSTVSWVWDITPKAGNK